jgi:hypothetical protein
VADASQKAEQLRKDYQSVFTSENGQRVLEDLKKTCFYYDTTLHEQPHIMSYQEGLRNVILHIETKLKLTADKIKELENERGQS